MQVKLNANITEYSFDKITQEDPDGNWTISEKETRYIGEINLYDEFDLNSLFISDSKEKVVVLSELNQFINRLKLELDYLVIEERKE